MIRRAAALAVVAALCALFGTSAASAATAVIGFDDLPAGTAIADQYAAQGVHFGVSPFPDMTGSFSVENSASARSAPRVAALDYDAGTDFSTSWIRFDKQQTSVTLRVCRPGSGTPNVNVEALDSNGTQVALMNGILCDPQGALHEVTISAAHITYISVGGVGSGWQMDDLEFETDPAPQAPPPPPPPPPPLPPPPNFTIAYDTPLLPSTIVVRPGERVTRTIVIDRNESSFGSIKFSMTGSGAPGLVVNFTPTTLSGTGRQTTTLSVYAEPDIAPTYTGDRLIQAEPQGPTPGPTTRTIPISILVQGQLSVQTRGIEITQGTQTREQPNKQEYEGVQLVKRKTTVVRVFASYSGTAPPVTTGYPRRPPLGMALYGIDSSERSLPGSPLSPVWSPAPDTLPVNDSNLSLAERDSASSAFDFVLPTSWTNGPKISLTARALAPAPSDDSIAVRLRPEPAAAAVCVSFRCGANPIRSLGQIPFRDPPPAKVISALSMLYVNNGTIPGIPKEQRITGVPNEPVKAFEKLLALSPVPLLFMDAYGGISPLPSYRAVIFAPTGAILEAAQGYDEASGRKGDFVMGLFAWPPGAGYAPGPRTGVADATVGTGGYPQRPLTTVAHETLHLLGLNHADSICGGGGGGFPTFQGRLSSTGLDTTWGSGAAAPGAPPFRTIPDELFGRGYDLMSYCAHLGDGDPDSWISARNWNRLLGTAAVAGTEVRRQTEVARPSLTVRARTTPTGVEISMVQPVSVPATTGDSPYTLVGRNAAGVALASVPMSQQEVTADAPGGVSQIDLVGSVPSAGVARVEVVAGGVVVASQARSASAPNVRFITPRAGATIGGSRPVGVRWSATDADGGALNVALEYSTDAGRTWTRVAGGANVGGARLPAGMLAASTRGRIRLVADDGFTVTTTPARAIVVQARPPAATITSPRPRQSSEAGAQVNLTGVAMDDRGHLVPSRRLRWYAGRTLVGRGASTSAVLPAGTGAVRLEAMDARGRLGTASVRVRVRPTTPFFLRLTTPKTLSRKATKVAITVAATQPATLRVGSFRATVGRGAKKITVPVRPGKSRLALRLILTAGGKRGEQWVLIPR